MLWLAAFLVKAEEQYFANCAAQIDVNDFASVASPKVKPNDLVVSPVHLTKGPLKHVKFVNLYLVVHFFKAFSTSAVQTKSSPYYLQYIKKKYADGRNFLCKCSSPLPILETKDF